MYFTGETAVIIAGKVTSSKQVQSSHL